MSTTTESILDDALAIDAGPSQLAVDNLTETLAALLDEAMALLGVSDIHTTMANLSLTRVPAAIWHAFPQPAIYAREAPRDAAWKHISTSGCAKLTIWCDHRAACPDLPENQAPGVDELHERAMADQPVATELVRLPNGEHARLRVVEGAVA